MRRSIIKGMLFSIYLISNSVMAAGFAIIEQSGSGMGTAYSGGAAWAQDASTIFFNPAGMTKVGPNEFSAALHVIQPKAEFNNNGSQVLYDPQNPGILVGGNSDGGELAPIPNIYAVYSLPNIKFGLGINAPFGMGVKYDENWVGRYFAIESTLRTVNFNPSIAYSIGNKWAIGLGMNFMYADVTLSNALDLGAFCAGQIGFSNCNPPPPAAPTVFPQGNDGTVSLEGSNSDAIGVGFNLGFLYEFNKNLRLGVAYRSEIDLELQGDANFTVPSEIETLFPGVFSDTTIKSETTLPQSLSISGVYQLNRELSLMADITWTGWSSFKELKVTFDNGLPANVTEHNWEDSFRVGVGANYELNRAVQLRGGLAFDQSPVPSEELRSPRIPDSDRTWLALGISYTINKAWIVDGALSYVHFAEAKVNNLNENAVHLIGEYDASALLLGLQAKYSF